MPFYRATSDGVKVTHAPHASVNHGKGGHVGSQVIVKSYGRGEFFEHPDSNLAVSGVEKVDASTLTLQQKLWPSRFRWYDTLPK